MAQSFMADATTSATDGSSSVPSSMVRITDWYTGLGSRCFMTARLNTFDAKNSPIWTLEKFSGSEIGEYVVTASMARRRSTVPLTLVLLLVCRSVPAVARKTGANTMPLVAARQSTGISGAVRVAPGTPAQTNEQWPALAPPRWAVNAALEPSADERPVPVEEPLEEPEITLTVYTPASKATRAWLGRTMSMNRQYRAWSPPLVERWNTVSSKMNSGSSMQRCTRSSTSMYTSGLSIGSRLYSTRNVSRSGPKCQDVRSRVLNTETAMVLMKR